MITGKKDLISNSNFFFLYLCPLMFENNHDFVETDDLKLVRVAELYDYHPLGCYKVKGRFYVPPRHYIHIPFTP